MTFSPFPRSWEFSSPKGKLRGEGLTRRRFGGRAQEKELEFPSFTPQDPGRHNQPRSLHPKPTVLLSPGGDSAQSQPSGTIPSWAPSSHCVGKFQGETHSPGPARRDTPSIAPGMMDPPSNASQRAKNPLPALEILSLNCPGLATWPGSERRPGKYPSLHVFGFLGLVFLAASPGPATMPALFCPALQGRA